MALPGHAAVAALIVPLLPAGKFLQTRCTSHGNDSVCVACPAGTFLSHPNTLSKCNACHMCDHQSEFAVLYCATLRHTASYSATLCHTVPSCAVLRRAALLTTRPSSFPDCGEQLLSHQQHRLWLRVRPLSRMPKQG